MQTLCGGKQCRKPEQSLEWSERVGGNQSTEALFGSALRIAWWALLSPFHRGADWGSGTSQNALAKIMMDGQSLGT